MLVVMLCCVSGRLALPQSVLCLRKPSFATIDAGSAMLYDMPATQHATNLFVCQGRNEQGCGIALTLLLKLLDPVGVHHVDYSSAYKQRQTTLKV